MTAEDHQHGRTVLHLSAEKGYDEFVEMLIVRGANMYASGEKPSLIYHYYYDSCHFIGSLFANIL